MPGNWTDEGWLWKREQVSQATAHLEPSHPDYARFGEDDLPVVLVTWHEAHAYARRLHLGYREEFQPNMSSNDLGFRLAALRLPVAAAPRSGSGTRRP